MWSSLRAPARPQPTPARAPRRHEREQVSRLREDVHEALLAAATPGECARACERNVDRVRTETRVGILTDTAPTCVPCIWFPRKESHSCVIVLKASSVTLCDCVLTLMHLHVPATFFFENHDFRLYFPKFEQAASIVIVFVVVF